MTVITEIKALRAERLKLLARVVEIESELDQIAEAVRGAGEPELPPRTHDARTPVHHKPSKLPPRPSPLPPTRHPRGYADSLRSEVLLLLAKHEPLTGPEIMEELKAEGSTGNRVLKLMVDECVLFRHSWQIKGHERPKPPYFYARTPGKLAELEAELIASGHIDRPQQGGARLSATEISASTPNTDGDVPGADSNCPEPITTDLSPR